METMDMEQIGDRNEKGPGTNYRILVNRVRVLMEKQRFYVTNLANASAAIWEALPRINWAGFYLRQGDELWLGPFQGKPACTKIPFGKGVCGTAAEQDRIQLVPDVEQFPGHIACDSASRSEIVIPIHQNGRVVGVLDMDSPEKDRFSPEDLEGLSALVQVLEETTDFPD